MKKINSVIIGMCLLISFAFASHEIGSPIFISKSKINIIRLAILIVLLIAVFVVLTIINKKNKSHPNVIYYSKALIILLVGILIITAIFEYSKGEYLDGYTYELMFYYPYDDYLNVVGQFIKLIFNFS